MATQAIALYSDLVVRMAEFRNPDAQATFERMLALQHRHADDSGPGSAGPPDVFQDEGMLNLRLVSPYQAFALAVRNQERAFAFWSYTSAHAAHAAIKDETERLPLEEMDPVKLLRSERRRSYQQSHDPLLERLRTASHAELRSEAAVRESAVARLHGRFAAALEEAGNPCAELMSEIAREEGQSAAALGGNEETEVGVELLPDDFQALLSLACERIEIDVEVYLRVAEESRGEDIVFAAHVLANPALHHLARLH